MQTVQNSAGNHTIVVLKTSEVFNNLRTGLANVTQTQVGCLHQPLFEILLSNIVTDELHLMLRVMDRLETGLILKDVDRDEADNQGKPPSKRYFPHLDALLAIIRSLRISLNMWKTREAGPLKGHPRWEERSDCSWKSFPAKMWRAYLTWMPGTGADYTNEIMTTPYIHILVYHTPTITQLLQWSRVKRRGGKQGFNEDWINGMGNK
ncbi:hypothetical protein pdam_00008033 [Pocillopora damicornis]|uniref:Uncharacterized protein n=1 Tax=Pocillopora damicornis TaxID=46731 RepID=A0A3M6TEP8_POCDA|nr:hypothetical protein pdam_00008033 [Pocillopora damicornis]